MKEKVTRKEVEAAIQKAIHDMFVDWSWCSDNPFIHPDRRMPSSVALAWQVFWEHCTCFLFYARSRIKFLHLNQWQDSQECSGL